jgi:hypothetical protein
VAEGIVDGLKAAQIDKEQADQAAAEGLLHEERELFRQHAAVWQSAKRNLERLDNRGAGCKTRSPSIGSIGAL